MRKTDTSVEDLVGMIERGELQLPEMQRQYVWRAPRVRDLLDSLYRGYPSGSILVWETDREQPTRDLALDQAASPFSGHKLLLDGQQRLTSLAAVLSGTNVRVRGRQKPIDILFNLEHPDGLADVNEVESDVDPPVDDDDEATEAEDEGLDVQERLRRLTFVVASRQLSALPNWVSVTEVFKSDGDGLLLKKAGVQGFDDPRYEKYSSRLRKLRAIRKYPYAMHVLERDLSYEEVAEIFVRVNSLGVKLRSSDLALAQITARWRDSLRLLEEFQEECEKSWWTFDLGLLVRAMVVFATGQSRFKTLANVPVSRLQQGWEQATEGLRFAMNLLKSNADIEDESLLTSPFFFLTLAYLAHQRSGRLGGDEERELIYWLFAANALGRYSRGSTETLLDADLATIRNGGSATDLVETLRKQFGRLEFEPTDFAGRTWRSSLHSLVFLALRARDAKDWRTGLRISLTHHGRLHYIESHHVFPKALLVEHGYEKGEIWEIANLAFVGGDTNRRLGRRSPFEYFPEIIAQRGEDALRSQCIPMDRTLWKPEAYREFLRARRTEMCSAVNEFLSSARAR